MVKDNHSLDSIDESVNYLKIHSKDEFVLMSVVVTRTAMALYVASLRKEQILI